LKFKNLLCLKFGLNTVSIRRAKGKKGGDAPALEINTILKYLIGLKYQSGVFITIIFPPIPPNYETLTRNRVVLISFYSTFAPTIYGFSCFKAK